MATQTWTDPDTGYTYELIPDAPEAPEPPKTWTDPKSGATYEVIPDTPVPAQKPVVKAPPAPTLEQQAGMTNISKGDPSENQRTFDTQETLKKVAMVRALAGNKAVDPLKAKKMVEDRFGNGESVDWYVDAIRKGYKGPINLYTPEAPGQTVEGTPETPTAAETVLGPLADTARGAKEGFERTGPNILRAGARLLSELGAIDPSVAEDLDKIDQLGRADYGDLYVDPNGTSRDVGNLLGSAVAESPLNELKIGGAGKIGELLDTAAQGAIGNVLYEGGKNPVENASVGALGGAALHGVIGVALSPLAKEEFGNAASRYVDTSHLGKIKEQIDYTVEGWAGAPEFRVVEKNKNLSKTQRAQMKADGVENLKDVQAYVAKDGRVHVLAQNIKDPSDIPGIVYHEVLGHSGLAKAFSDDLDGLMDKIYESNWSIRKQTDKYIEQNPSVYKNVDQRARATEETLAEMSEKGKVDLTAWESVKDVVRNYGRELGLDLRYTDADVKAILKRAHSSITDDAGTMAPSGNRYIKAYHGSTKDFEKLD